MSEPHPAEVTVERTGGIAGLRRQWRVHPAPEDLPRWRALLDACPWDEPLPSSPGADRYRWRIHADDGITARDADLPDACLEEGPWRRLVDAVRAERH